MVPALLPLRAIFFALVGVLSISTTAFGTNKIDPTADCTNPGNTKEKIIQSCTRLINASNSSSRTKIIALINRGVAYEPRDLQLARVDLDQALKFYDKRFFSAAGLSASKPTAFKANGSPLTNIEWAEAFNKRGDVEANSLNFSAAIPYYAEAARINPWSDSYQSSLGVSYRKREQFEDAMQHLNRAVTLNPKSAYNHLQRAYTYTYEPDKARADFAEAAALYTAAIDQIEANARSSGRPASNLEIYYNRLGNSNLGFGNIDGAVDNFTKALKIRPDYAAAFNGLGQAYIAKRRYDLAVQNLGKAIQVEPKLALAYGYRGQAYMESAAERKKRGMPLEEQKVDLTKAQTDLKQALYLDPSLVDVHANFNKVNAELAQVRSEIDRPAPPPPSPPANGQQSDHHTQSAPTAETLERRLAFSVGNNVYPALKTVKDPQQGQLNSPTHDAQLIGENLHKLRFEVTELENLTQDRFVKEYEIFLAKIQPGDTVLIYFSGHGASVRGVNLFLPTDVPLLDPFADATPLLSKAIVQLDLVKLAQEKGAKLVVVISDACRNDPFAPATQKSPATKEYPRKDLSMKPVAVSGALMIYAAGDGQTALDGMSLTDNSLFTKYLAPELLVEKQDVVYGVENAKEKVARMAAHVKDPDGSPHKQYPAIYDETIGGRIYFNGAPPMVVAESNEARNLLVKSVSFTSVEAPVLAPQ